MPRCVPAIYNNTLNMFKNILRYVVKKHPQLEIGK